VIRESMKGGHRRGGEEIHFLGWGYRGEALFSKKTGWGSREGERETKTGGCRKYLRLVLGGKKGFTGGKRSPFFTWKSTKEVKDRLGGEENS